MESQFLVKKRVNDNLLKENCILETKGAANEQYSWWECLEILRILPDNISNNPKTILKIFNVTGITVDSRDVEVCHCLNQLANPKMVIIKLSKWKDVAREMNNKKKFRSIKPRNISLQSTSKIYITER